MERVDASASAADWTATTPAGVLLRRLPDAPDKQPNGQQEWRMYMFFGDSNVRQFLGIAWGVLCHYVFSGATIKGLMSPDSTTGAGVTIREALRHDRQKTVFMMFGSVDINFSLVRELAIRGNFDEERFIDDRLQIYKQFVEGIISDRNISRSITKICILCPQISPFIGESYFAHAPGRIGITEAELRAAAGAHDLSDRSRTLRVVTFNDRLEALFADNPLVHVLRIDRQMIGEEGLIRAELISSDGDHHARTSITSRMWAPIVQAHIADQLYVG